MFFTVPNAVFSSEIKNKYGRIFNNEAWSDGSYELTCKILNPSKCLVLLTL